MDFLEVSAKRNIQRAATEHSLHSNEELRVKVLLHTVVIISVIRHVALKCFVDLSTEDPRYTSHTDIMVANKLDTRGLHWDNDDTPVRMFR